MAHVVLGPLNFSLQKLILDDRPGRARRGASGALNSGICWIDPKSAIAGSNASFESGLSRGNSKEVKGVEDWVL